MSEFTVIRAVGFTLRELLEEHITNSSEPQVQGVPIKLQPPKDLLGADETRGISLWLYQVTRNGETLNHPPQRVGPTQVRPHPLPIDLHYLATPIASTSGDEQALLGRILQTFNDHAILRGTALRDSLRSGPEELRLSLDTFSLEELTRVWDSLQEPYHLSVAYTVQMVSVDSNHEPVEAQPVLTKDSTYTQILSVR